MSNKLKFNHSNGVVTKLWEWDDGRWERETIDRNETWTYKSGQLIKKEWEHGRLETEIYTDLNKDGIFILEKKIKSKSSHLQSSKGNDNLKGDDRDDLIHGHNGHDKIYGGKGKDKLYGDDGNDYLYAGSHNDYARGGSGKDHIWGDTGNDRLHGDGGHDKVYGGKGNDKLYGESGNDRLYGGSGNDLLIGGGGKDRVSGQGGRDTFRVQRGGGYTIIEDFTNGQDRIQLGSGRSGLKLKTRGDDVLLYQRGDLMAIVEDAAGDLQLRGNYLV
jgi:Ca2+-binding RTX toxin-like protein